MNEQASSWHVRVAVREDQTAICRFWWALMEEQMASDPELWLACDARERWCRGFVTDVRSSIHAFYVAEDAAGSVVGFAHAYLMYPPPLYAQELEAFLAEIYVEPSWRGKGVGHALVEQIRQWALSKQAKRVRLEVLARNEKAPHFWNREGFRPFSILAIQPLSGNRKD